MFFFLLLQCSCYCQSHSHTHTDCTYVAHTHRHLYIVYTFSSRALPFSLRSRASKCVCVWMNGRWWGGANKMPLGKWRQGEQQIIYVLWPGHCIGLEITSIQCVFSLIHSRVTRWSCKIDRLINELFHLRGIPSISMSVKKLSLFWATFLVRHHHEDYRERDFLPSIIEYRVSSSRTNNG